MYSAPIPGSLEAIIAASAAAAALRSRTFSDEALEESTSEEQAIAELVEETPIEEPSAEESVEETPVEEPAADESVEAEPIEAVPADEESVEEAPVEEAPIEEIPEEEFVAEAPIPGSLEAIIAANAAAAALRSRAFSDAALEEATAEDREIAELVEETPIEEPAADESVEAEPIEAVPADEESAEEALAAETKAVVETEATAEAQVKEAPAPVKEPHTRSAHRPEPLRAAKARNGRPGHSEGRVSMREAARRAGLSKD